MHNQHKIFRVLQLIQLLQSQARTITQMAESLESTDRTVYRYLDLLRELGYQIRKDITGRYFINHPDKSFFSSEEIKFLIQILQNTSNKSIIARSLLKKIVDRFVEEEEEIQEFNFRSGSNLVQLMEAIQKKKQVELVRYHSASSESIAHRWVEPIRFTPDLQCLVAFEIKSKKNKYFHLNRMESVRILDHRFKFENEHRFVPPDLFGFNETGVEMEIDLVLSFKAKIWIQEAYPQSHTLLKELKKGKFFRMTTIIYDERPLRRLMEGLPDDIWHYSDWKKGKK
jgi:predicted DNA-binding transcriptional regulator YafY